jgi:hypothetical protein
MTGSGADVRTSMRNLSLAILAIAWTTGLASGATVEQASMEYGGSAVRDMLSWSVQAAQDYWYYMVGAVVLLLLLRAYSRK